MIPNSGLPSGSFHVGITTPVQAHVSLEKAKTVLVIDIRL
jgi:hypothetical protein